MSRRDSDASGNGGANGEHRELSSLLGAYALNALSQLEHRRVERHLETCPDCAREARLLGQPAAELALLAGTSPVESALVDRIVSAVPEPIRTQARWTRPLAALAAAAVLAVAILGGAFMKERSHREELTRVIAQSQREVPLEPQAGFAGRGKLYLGNGRAVMVLSEIPDAGPARSYQLWSLGGPEPESMDVFESEGGRVTRLLDVKGEAQQYAVTVEPEGGSKAPSSTPILQGA